MAKEKEEKQKKNEVSKKEKKALKKAEKKAQKKDKKKNSSYIKEVNGELKKVKWPSKEEMFKYSIAVIVFIVIFGLYFYALDAFFAWVSSLVKGL